MKCEPWNPQTGKYGPLYDEDTESYGPDEVYTETKLNSAFAFGGPKCLVKVIQKLSGLSINRFMAVDFAGLLEDGRRARRRRGVQHHSAGGLRAGHRAAQRRAGRSSTATPR